MNAYLEVVRHTFATTDKNRYFLNVHVFLLNLHE